MSRITRFYTRQQVYQLDKLAISEDAQGAQQLMGRAAQACWNALSERWPGARHIVIFAGSGNNGGDAFGVAVLAQKAALDVTLFCLSDCSHQSPASAFYRQQFEHNGGCIEPYTGAMPACDVIVDGLFGIGLDRPLDERYQQLIQQINAHSARRLAIDIPSGLNADTGMAMPLAVRADCCVTFIARKIGQQLADGPDYCGQLCFDDLGLSRAASKRVPALTEALTMSDIRLPQRANNAYKNSVGHVLVVGGDEGLSGAVRLACRAALRGGAGLVSACVHAANVAIVASDQAEIMVGHWGQLEQQLARASVVLVGPGLGQSKAALDILHRLSQLSLPMVIDADALTPTFLDNLASTDYVLTPHPGEAARLLQSTAQQVQQDRLQALQQINEHWPGVCVLKGAGTLVAAENEAIKLCPYGHAGMATAGMGDVLAGIVASYRGQGLPPAMAAQSAVLVHALAAQDFTRQQDGASLIASDVIDRIGGVAKRIRQVQTA